jgi:hypothetical protein
VPDLSALPIGQLPDASELVNRSYEFSQKLLEANKAYVAQLLNAWSPVTAAAKGEKADAPKASAAA